MKNNLFLIGLFAVGSLFLNGCNQDDDDDLDEVTSFTDQRDGKTYDIVKIGTQTWFAENLRYSGSTQEVSDNAAWAATDQPAWCYHDNNPANDAIYGKLYNWYAVNSGSICPSGWHIPTDDEWTILTDHLGGENIASGKMKATTGWDAPNTGATNSSGFSALPGAGRDYGDGDFFSVGRTSLFWSSTETGGYVYARDLDYDAASIFRFANEKKGGLSCRCVKD